MLRREEVERVKEQYPKGTPIRLYSMEGEQTVPPGSRGIVDHVDDIGQIHMKWENGSCLALNVEEDCFEIITQQDELCEKKEQEFIDKINEILDKTDFLLLNTSCNTENTSYAAEKLLAMHQAFEEVYGEGYVDESYGMIMMPAVVRGRESGIQALALVTLDLESSGEHWGTTFLTPGGPLVQGHAELSEEQKRIIREYYIPYDYWYTPLVERDHHVNFTDMPESVADIRRLVDESLVTGQAQQIENGIKTATGQDKWYDSVIFKMLRNEKYMVDTLLQKTYTVDFMTKKKVINKGIVPQYYVEDDHEPIIPKELFYRVQEELARRASMNKSAVTRKKNQKSKFSSEYALTGLLLCGDCGQEYRRVTWSRNGKKKIVWRCSNRLTNGTKNCKKSETLEEGALNRAVMEAINRITKGDGDFVGAFRQNVIRVIGSYGGEQEPDEYDEKIDVVQ